MPYQRTFEFAGSTEKVVLRIEEGGAGKFRIIVSVPGRPHCGDVTIAIPSEQADLITHAIGKAADASGE